MNKDLFRSIVKWVGIVAIFHLATFILSAVLLSALINQSLTHEDGMAQTVTILFSLVSILILCAWEGRQYYNHDESRRRALQLAKDEPNGLLPYWLREVKRELYRPLVYLIFQLPMLVICATIGYAYENQLFIEKFFAADAGFYVMTPNAFVGWLLSGLYLLVLFSIIRLGILLAHYKESRK